MVNKHLKTPSNTSECTW